MASETERRAKARFPIELKVLFLSKSRREGLSGSGHTLNISSTGLLIASKSPVPEGARLELTLDWPWLLDGVTPLQLVAESLVVRSNESAFAVAFERHQFRTRRR